MARKPGKSETLTIRLDPKTRFMLEFVSRLRGQTITTVVERAIAVAADRATIDQVNPLSKEADSQTWRNYWDISEGVRAIRMSAEPQLHPTYEEERRLAFVNKHPQFFYVWPDIQKELHLGYIDVLWPRIDEFVTLDDESMTTDYFAAGKAMIEALRAADLEPPEWQPKPKPKPALEGGIDDDVPL